MTGNVGGVGNIATAGWNAVPLGTGAFYAPLPQSAAGVGQEETHCSGARIALYLPDTGLVLEERRMPGMWYWWGYGQINGDAVLDLPEHGFSQPAFGIAAGGNTNYLALGDRMTMVHAPVIYRIS